MSTFTFTTCIGHLRKKCPYSLINPPVNHKYHLSDEDEDEDDEDSKDSEITKRINDT